MFVLSELDAMPRKELQALAKENDIKGNQSSAVLVAALMHLNPANAVTTSEPEPENIIKAEEEVPVPEVVAEAASAVAFEIAQSAECECLVDGAWIAATIMRVNKKTVRITSTQGDFTVKNEDVRAASARSSDDGSSTPISTASTQPADEAEAESHDDAFAGLNITMEAYEQENEADQVDWLAACCSEEPSGRKGRKSVAASMAATATAKQPWNSTPYKEPKKEKEGDAPKDLRRKSFSNTPTKLSAPAIVPKMNKAVALIMEQRKQKMLADKAKEGDAKKDAVFTARPKMVMPVRPAATLIRKSYAPAARPASQPASSSSSIAASSSSTSAVFKAKKMPNFSALHKHCPAKENAATSANALKLAQPVSAKAAQSVKSDAQKVSAFIEHAKFKRQSTLAVKRGLGSSSVSSSSSSGRVGVTATAAPLPSVGPHGPFSTIVA